ncbi:MULTISPECIES: hypothetical protein [unclassified Mycobacterium]|uniref:hypothetical protein n=1 Tax=unclassified Mycobacterium TaxID=2642494 RepID=UPI0029C7B98D|nr:MULTISPECIES: hypothetical protein [unclassified Mycobacterium]
MTRNARTGARRRRAVAAALALVAVGATGGVAHASPNFDDFGYSTCTATTVPGPDQTFDDVATACCVNHAGVPAATTYGIGCVAQVDNPPPDYRPTIFMPTRPGPPGEGDATLDELDKLPPLPPLP